ncbi:hypothetical protein GCM10010172_57700 [Paractinoplanes ferrugineus]|uniref:Uncharacterized protein n=1 Tax=Paractinoplanes ferrugineus TaxID=113564 RepID=A0A919J6U5_9ACTN|nr:hypothetical protein Afe05nite_77660 [Actinoplanes ferrugineus]
MGQSRPPPPPPAWPPSAPAGPQKYRQVYESIRAGAVDIVAHVDRYEAIYLDLMRAGRKNVT